MKAGIHLPQIDLRGEGLSLRRLTDAAAAAVECGFSALSVNDHLVFRRPWLDGPTALAAVLDRSADLTVMTSIALPAVRGAVPLAKTLAALDVLSSGRLVAGVGPGSSEADYAAVGVPFAERWRRFDAAVPVLRELAPGVPLWIGSWGSAAGLRRVAQIGDGWLASAYNTDPPQFAECLDRLGGPAFPHALGTMWTWVTQSAAEADRVLAEVVAPLVGRDPATLRGRVCVGSAAECARLLSRYAGAGCRQVQFWPVGDERRQLELLATEVLPRVAA